MFEFDEDEDRRDRLALQSPDEERVAVEVAEEATEEYDDTVDPGEITFIPSSYEENDEEE